MFDPALLMPHTGVAKQLKADQRKHYRPGVQVRPSGCRRLGRLHSKREPSIRGISRRMVDQPRA